MSKLLKNKAAMALSFTLVAVSLFYLNLEEYQKNAWLSFLQQTFMGA